MHNVIDARSTFNVRRCMVNIEREVKKFDKEGRYQILAAELEDGSPEVWIYDWKTDSAIGPVDLSLLTRR